jgi:transglutaminase-like putative cysteine protease
MVQSVDEGYAMGNRWSWIVGTAGLTLAILRLGRLLRPTVEGAPWQVAVAAGAVMGAAITWAMRGRWSILVSNALALTIVALRIAVPNTLSLGLFPTSGTVSALGRELDLGIVLIRTGIAPVSPIAGLVVILTAVFWVLAAVTAWGIKNRHPLIGLAPSLLFYLQLAVIDQAPAGARWTIPFLAVVGLALGVIAHDREFDSTLRMRSSNPAYLPYAYPALFIAASVLVAFGGVRLVSHTVPAAGLVDWRNHAGIGGGFVIGLSYNLFTNIQQELLSPSDTPVFTASINGDVDPSELYWELITLEDFDGQNWVPRRRETKSPDAETWEDPEMAFFGPTTPVGVSVRIANLQQNFLPVLYSPTWLGSDLALFNSSYGVRTDGSVQFILSWDGLTYQEAALVPTPDIDVLASADGTLTPIFQEAANRGAFDGHAVPTPIARHPASLSDDLKLPDLEPIIRTQTQAITADGTGAYEKALLLDAWFRDPNNFTYSLDVRPGHTATELADWLFATDSPNYRTGYCEQFATAMAVMARTIGIPSRVVLGFGPSDVLTDGTIVVRDKNAHAWVELWMDKQGWVRFDPTPGGAGASSTNGQVQFDPRQYIPPPPESTEPSASGSSPVSRRQLPEEGGSVLPVGESGDLPVERQPLVTFERIIGLAVLLLLLLSPLLVKEIRRRRRLARFRSGNVFAAWDELLDRLRDLGVEHDSSLTPMEVATSVQKSMLPLASGVTEALFGRTRRLDRQGLSKATRSFFATESYLKTTYPAGDRLRARMRLRSLL